jgi:pimeloyl-ACP methyl ester carboxylesterase
MPILPTVKAPVMMLSGDKSRIASASQKAFAERLPNARLELIEGYGHGVNLLVPERCARATLSFWQSIGG